MPRQLKPYLIGEVTDARSRVTVQVYLDRNAEPKVFFGEVSGERVQADSESGCRQAILAKLHEVVRYEWRRVIVVHTGGETAWDRGLRVEYRVHEIAERPPGATAYRPYAERRTAMMPSGPHESVSDYTGPTESDPAKGTFVLPHSDVTVAALDDLRDRMETLEARLREILGADNAPALLAGMVARLLPAASGDEGC